jgi:hypothetical protein
MKAFALAVAVAAGVALSAGTADAQYRSRGSYRYVAPTYVAPAYSYPTYGSVVTSSYATPYVSSYTPGTVVYSGGTYYDSMYAPTYSSYPTYYGNSYYGSYPSYGNSYYSPGVNITPSGVNWNGRRIWRW